MDKLLILFIFANSVSLAQINDHETRSDHMLQGNVESAVVTEYLDPNFTDVYIEQKFLFNERGDLLRFVEEELNYDRLIVQFEYGDSGRLTSRTERSEDLETGKERYERRTYYYNNLGFLSEVYVTDDSLKDPWKRETYSYNMNEIRWDLLRQNGKLQLRKVHYRNSLGIDTLTMQYYEEHVLFEKVREIYDSTGRHLRSVAYRNDKLNWSWDYEYHGDSLVLFHIHHAMDKDYHTDFVKSDSAGNQILFVYEIGLLAQKNQNRFEYIYDSEGNWIEFHEYLTILSRKKKSRWKDVKSKDLVEEKVTFKKREISYFE